MKTPRPLRRPLGLLLGLLAFSSLKGQHLLDYSLVREYSQAEVQTILNQLGIPPSVISASYGAEVYKVTYETPNATGTAMTTASGAVVFPKGYLCGLPMACYTHGTVLAKNNVPSQSSFELNLGVLWAGGGYAVAMPDYLGLGESPGRHPYLHAKSEATASTDMILAAQSLADSLGQSLNGELFIYGYSQGGHAALATLREIQENHSDSLQVTACFPMSGPYDMSGTQSDFVNAGQPYPTPAYLPYVVLSYQEVYGNIYQNDVGEVLDAPYDQSLPPFFNGNFPLSVVNPLCSPIPNDMLAPDFENDFNNNPQNPLRLALADNDLLDWTPQTTLRLIYCEGDDQVAYQNSLVAADTFIAQGATDVTTANLGNNNHSDCIQPALLVTYISMDSFRTKPVELLLDASVEADAISLTPNPALGGLSFDWSNGDTTASITDLVPGSYSVTVSAPGSCSASFSFDIIDTSVDNNPLAAPLRLFPNPAREGFQLSFPQKGDYRIRALDVNGRLIREMSATATDGVFMDTKNWPEGLYWVEVLDRASGYRQIARFSRL